MVILDSITNYIYYEGYLAGLARGKMVYYDSLTGGNFYEQIHDVFDESRFFLDPIIANDENDFYRQLMGIIHE